MTDSIEILGLAASAIGDRAPQYGDVTLMARRAADISSSLLETEVSPRAVLTILLAVKLARLQESQQHLDSYVDAAAYVALIAQVARAKGPPNA
jgi:hypothetical protein